MKILYFTWFENSSADIINAFVEKNHMVNAVSIPVMDYNHDPVFCDRLEKVLDDTAYDFIFSFNFFPLISHTAEKYQLPYISWIYDMPHLTLFSPAVYHPVNYIFLFDYQQFTLLKARKAPHVYHLPLAADTRRLSRLLGSDLSDTNYKSSVSFVGSLYENCQYNQINYLPPYLYGYLDGIMQVQKKLYGCDIIEGMLTDEIITQLNQYISLDIPKDYELTPSDLYHNMINAKITSMERISMLGETAAHYPLSLYTGSDKGLVPLAQCQGYISYEEEMPFVFRQSKINLNITLRSISSGIPLRAIDILGAGGFLLSNYQTELAQYFKDGEELVLFDSEQDLLQKTEYYLTHDKERQEIAENGWQKTQKEFSYAVKVAKILDAVFGENTP